MDFILTISSDGKAQKIISKSNHSSPNSVRRLIPQHDDCDMMMILMMTIVKLMITVVRLHTIIFCSMGVRFASVL
jgi:hypothetical protein